MLANERAARDPRTDTGRAAPQVTPAVSTEDGTRLTVMGLPEAVCDLSPDWAGFSERVENRSPFLRLDYLALWARVFGVTDRCRVVTVHRDRDLVGLGPFMVVDEPLGPLKVPGLRLIGNNLGYAGDVMYSDIAAVAPRSSTVRAILKHVSRWRFGTWDFGYLPPGAETAALATSVLGGTSNGGLRERQQFVGRPLPPDWDAFLRELSGEARRNFRRRVRRLSEIGALDVRIARTPEEVRTTVGDLVRNHERWSTGTTRERWFGGESAKRFLVEAATLLAKQGTFLAHTLEIGGRPIAWNVGTCNDGCYFEQVASYDHTYRACAPGVLLGMFVVQSLIEWGERRIELGPGFDERKRRLGGIPTDYERLHGYRGWARTAVALHHRLFRRGTIE